MRNQESGRRWRPNQWRRMHDVRCRVFCLVAWPTDRLEAFQRTLQAVDDPRHMRSIHAGKRSKACRCHLQAEESNLTLPTLPWRHWPR
jgi:hypothetical protein